MIKQYYIPHAHWLLLCLIGIWISGCSGSDSNNVLEKAEATPTLSISVQSSAVVFATMEDLLKHTEIVIIGRPVGEKGIINAARDLQDLTRTDPERFDIGQVYEVEVISYILGDGPKTLYVAQYHGSMPFGSQEFSESDIEAARERENIIPLALNERYVMFLVYSEYAYEGYPIEQLTLGRGHPWRFRVNEQDCVLAEDADPWLLRLFPPQTLEEFIQWVENPGLYAGDPAYPGPEVSNSCEINPLGNPYP